MSTTAASLEARPLTAQAFAPFGRVVEHRGTERRHYFPDLLGAFEAPLRQAVWVTRIEAPLSRRTEVQTLERHPHSAQLFVPLRGQPSLIVVCAADAEGAPDLASLRAFVASPFQGVSYARNVWHHGLAVLTAPAEFVVAMAVGAETDDVFLRLPQPIAVTIPDQLAEREKA